MSIKSVLIRRDRKALTEKLRSRLDEFTEKRELSSEDKAELDKMSSEVDSLGELAERLEKQESVENDIASKRDDDEQDRDDDEQDRDDEDSDSEQSSRFYSRPKSKAETRKKNNAASRRFIAGLYPELTRGKWARPELRDIVLGTNTSGGYFATPVQLVEGIIVAINNLSFMRQVATVKPYANAANLGVRQMTVQPTAQWESEGSQTTPDSATTLGLRELNPNLITCLITESLRMLQASNDVEAILKDRATYQTSILAEAGYIAGSGSGQPLGLFTASASGIPTSQDVTAGVSLSKNFTIDDVYDMLYSQPQQYRLDPSYAVFGHRSVAGYIRTLKDAIGNYLWQPSVIAGEPDNLAGHKFYQSEYAPSLNPSSPTASQYVLCAGAMKYYEIADVVGEESPQFQRLTERFADSSLIGLMFRFFTDGCPVLPAAFARLKLAAS